MNVNPSSRYWNKSAKNYDPKHSPSSQKVGREPLTIDDYKSLKQLTGQYGKNSAAIRKEANLQ